MTTRIERVKSYRDKVNEDWTEKWWSFMMEYEPVLDWTYISQNPNLTMEIIEANPDKPWY